MEFLIFLALMVWLLWSFRPKRKITVRKSENYVHHGTFDARGYPVQITHRPSPVKPREKRRDYNDAADVGFVGPVVDYTPDTSNESDYTPDTKVDFGGSGEFGGGGDGGSWDSGGGSSYDSGGSSYDSGGSSGSDY